MSIDVRTTRINIQQRIIAHYKQLLRQTMNSQERQWIQEKLRLAEAELAELIGRRSAA